MPAVSSITDLVSADEIRALLGVNAKELKSATIQLTVYFRNLQVTTDRLDNRLWALYESLPDPVVDEDEIVFERAFLHYAAYQSAKIIGASLHQFSPKMITDGKAAIQRNLNSQSDVMGNIETALGEAILALTSAAAELLPVQEAAAVSPLISRVTFGASDPVTG